MGIWLYRRPARPNVARSITRLFVSYHVFTVLVQMVWRTLDAAPTWSRADPFTHSRPFWMLTTVYLVCWAAAMFRFPGHRRRDS